MRCLCCGKPIETNEFELSCQWHKKCIKNFFDTTEIPDIELSDSIIKALADASTNKGFTVTGVQKKLSLHLSNIKNEKPRLTLVNYPSGYILKPQTEEYASLPEAEYLAMKMAKNIGINTVPFALIKNNDENISYITKRIDRQNNKILAMEDFCQLAGRLTEDKYKGSYEHCAKIISKFSHQPMLDLTELFLRLVFSFAIGNSDMHLKNFSLIEKDENSGQYTLSPAYDLLPVNTVNPADKEQFALTMNGKKRNLHKGDFLKFAISIGLSRKIAENLIGKIIKSKNYFIEECINSYLPDNMKTELQVLIEKRISDIL